MSKTILTPDFNAVLHEYQVCGIRKPSVTQILGEYIKVKLFGGTFYIHVVDGVAIPEETMIHAQDFGRAIHKGAYHLLLGHGLAWDSLNEVLVPVLRQVAMWVESRNPGIVLCEQPLYSAQYDYCGTPDLICWLKISGKVRLCVIDFKTGLYELAGPQTSAYENLYREYSGYKGIVERWVLHLPKDGGDYVFVPLRRRDDFTYFLNKRAQWNWLKKAAI